MQRHLRLLATTTVTALLTIDATLGTKAWAQTPATTGARTQDEQGRDPQALAQSVRAALSPSENTPAHAASFNGQAAPLLAWNALAGDLEGAAGFEQTPLDYDGVGSLDARTLVLAQAQPPGGPQLPAGNKLGKPIPLQSVIVTVEKREEELRDVPATVNVLSNEDIISRHLNNFSDYANTLPGVFLADVGPGEQLLSVRGIVATFGAGGFPIASYFGEARTDLVAPNGGFQNLRLVDIDRVELLQGPQGTLYGANSLSGVLHIVPNPPDLSDYQISAAASGFSTDHSSGVSDHVESAFNVPVIADMLAVRIVAYQDHDTGYINDIVPAAGPSDYSALNTLPMRQPPGTLVIPAHGALNESAVNSQDTYGGRLAARYEPIDDLQVDLSYARQEVRLNGENGVDAYLGEFTQSLLSSIYVTPKIEEVDGVGQLVVRYRDSDVRYPFELVSATSETQFDRLGLQDVGSELSGLPELPISFSDRGSSREFNQELRVQSAGRGPFQYLVGIYYQNSDIQGNDLVQDFSCPTCLAQHPNAIGYPVPPSNLVSSTNGYVPFARSRQQSVFTNLSYEITTQLKAQAGVRYLRDSQEVFSPPQTGLLAKPGLPTAGRSNSVVAPSASLTFKPTQELTTYVQASKGFRPGSPNALGSFEGTPMCKAAATQLGVNKLTDPDVLYSEELGIKASVWNGKLLANLSAFHQTVTRFQLFGFDGCTSQPIINGGDVVGNGGQLDLKAILPYGFQVNLAASYVRNHFSSVNPTVAPFDSLFVGEELPGAPSLNGTAGVQYDFALSARWKGSVRADYNYVGDVQYLFSGAVPFTQGGYGTANLRVSFQHNDYEFALFARNIGDKYAVEYSADPALGQGNLSYIIPPRQIGAEIRVRLDSPLQ